MLNQKTIKMFEQKFKIHFANHAPLVFTLEELMQTNSLENVLYKGEGGYVTHKRSFINSKDSEGSDVFEGDILEAPSGERFVVKWKEDELRWAMYSETLGWLNMNMGILKVVDESIQKV